MISIEANISLKQFNTFGIKAFAHIFAEADTSTDLRTILNIFRDNPLPKLILGGGSNLLFTRNFEGIVIYPVIKGIEVIKQDDDFIWVKAFAGENWDAFVKLCVSRNWGGIENLSLIPGNVGACPVQNIGAYGVEVKDTIDSVNTIDLTNGESITFSNNDCKYGYRDSIFKNELKNKYLIESVVFRLTKNPKPNKEYKDVLEELKNFDTISILAVRQAIINIRHRKLPDPEQLGNAGSFFKNPMITKTIFDKIKSKFPAVPFYPVSDKEVKIPAAWLIETSGWKDKREGNTGTHPTQPLVIVNYGGATGEEIYTFAKKIQKSVLDKFEIELEMEVRII